MPRHTLCVLVQNRPGVLARTTGLFSRRGFNVESVAVGGTHQSRISRITIVVNAEDRLLEQVVKQIGKLVEVLKIVALDGPATIARGHLLVTVRADRQTRSEVVEVAHLFGAHPVDVAPGAVTIEAMGSTDKLAAMLRVLEPFGIADLVQSGTIAISRSDPGAVERPVPVALAKTA